MTGGNTGDDSTTPPSRNDPHRMSRCGKSLYELMDLPKESTASDITSKYRRLALKYHPDKNPDNPDSAEMFKKLNRAKSVLTDPLKRPIYDKYGSFGLFLGDSIGYEYVNTILFLTNPWFECLAVFVCLLTGCCFGCFFCCCCCCLCCGKCKPSEEDDDTPSDIPNSSVDDEEHVQTSEPSKDKSELSENTSGSVSPTHATDHEANTSKQPIDGEA